MNGPTYAIRYTTAAARQIKKFDQATRVRIARTIELLAANPRPPASKPLVGGEGEWRVRTGDYRVVYEIRDDELVVLIVRAAHRREVYR